ncbi:hypothetical protein I8H84_02680 [Candidatus Saccharibacteria bacterium]|nr:hypothetical protein [Candidatus Saccharibacteria bacterium]MBH1972849.1 hypothetical protein [Candidatus Saccharibacteria bacterium]MBH1991050.1 hypothetical protein [Candidatus Saccharibacteria bacterium]
MDDRLDIPYESVHPETKLDKKFRMYDEADELYEKFIKEIDESNLSGLTKVICLFNIKTQRLERVLNDFYDRIAITSSRPNPYVTSEEISNKKAGAFRRKKEKLGFADLTLGAKLVALKLFHYKVATSEKQYQDYLKELDNFIKNRNQIIHNLFTQNLETKQKIQTIIEESVRLEVLLIDTERRESLFVGYLSSHIGEYWDLSPGN